MRLQLQQDVSMFVVNMDYAWLKLKAAQASCWRYNVLSLAPSKI